MLLLLRESVFSPVASGHTCARYRRVRWALQSGPILGRRSGQGHLCLHPGRSKLDW